MAASVVAAVLDKIATIASGAATYFDEAPPTDGTGNRLQPPYVVLTDEGMETEYDLQHNVLEKSTLTLTAYAPTLAAADTIAAALKYAGGSVTAGLGLDFGTLPTLAYPASRLAVVRTGERRFLAGLNVADARVHAVEMRYTVTLLRTP